MADGEVASSAPVQGELWGERARDWAEVQEPMAAPLFAAALDAAGVGAGTSLLDAGCGAGALVAMAVERGAQVTGLDASEAMIEIARERAPGADLRVGALEALPFPDDSFDAVLCINAFPHAADILHAVRELGRVARPGAPVVISTWGGPERCQTRMYLTALASFAPTPGMPGPFAFARPGILERLARDAGLTPERVQDVDCPWEYPDEPTALRGLLSCGPAVRAIRNAGEAGVARALSATYRLFPGPGGGFRLGNSHRFVLARA